MSWKFPIFSSWSSESFSSESSPSSPPCKKNWGSYCPRNKISTSITTNIKAISTKFPFLLQYPSNLLNFLPKPHQTTPTLLSGTENFYFYHFTGEVFCFQVMQNQTFARGTKAYTWKLFVTCEFCGTKNSTNGCIGCAFLKKLTTKTNSQFCSVLFSFDRRFPKNVKTYSTSIFNSSVLYVFTFFGKHLSKENKTEQNWPSLLVLF